MFGPEAIQNFLYSLEIMGLGMVGIFVVMLVLILFITVLTKIGSGSKKDRS